MVHLHLQVLGVEFLAGACGVALGKAGHADAEVVASDVAYEVYEFIAELEPALDLFEFPHLRRWVASQGEYVANAVILDLLNDAREFLNRLVDQGEVMHAGEAEAPMQFKDDFPGSLGSGAARAVGD